MNISTITCYSKFSEIKSTGKDSMKTMVNLIKEKSLPAMSFGEKVGISLSSRGFFSYKNFYLNMSGIFSCRETLTSMLENTFRLNSLGEEQKVFIFVRMLKNDPILKYSNAKIAKFTLNFLNQCLSYRWATNNPRVIDKSDVRCFTRPNKLGSILVFPITINDRGKSYTTASALISLLRFPEYIFTKLGNERKMGGIIKVLKTHFLKFGDVAHNDENPETYFGHPHYSAYFILWLVFAKYGVNIVSPHPSGPIELMRRLTKRNLSQSILRQNYNASLTGILSLGDEFLMKLGPTIYSFIEDRKKALKL